VVFLVQLASTFPRQSSQPLPQHPFGYDKQNEEVLVLYKFVCVCDFALRGFMPYMLEGDIYGNRSVCLEASVDIIMVILNCLWANWNLENHTLSLWFEEIVPSRYKLPPRLEASPFYTMYPLLCLRRILLWFAGFWIAQEITRI
jgi:hypothetical protein